MKKIRIFFRVLWCAVKMTWMAACVTLAVILGIETSKEFDRHFKWSAENVEMHVSGTILDKNEISGTLLLLTSDSTKFIAKPSKETFLKSCVGDTVELHSQKREYVDYMFLKNEPVPLIGVIGMIFLLMFACFPILSIISDIKSFAPHN